MNRTPSAQQTLQRLPKKWAVAIVVALIAYTLLQPFANNRLGWKLPSLASVLGMEQPAPKITPKSTPASDSNSQSADDSQTSSSATQTTADTKSKQPETKQPATKQPESKKPESKQPAPKQNTDKATSPQPDTKKPSEPKKPADTKSSSAKSTTDDSSQADTEDLLYGLLKDAGREVYISPAGLRYTRGSEEGHRLKHVEKHLKDIPDRPGKHGVFDGDMAQVLRWIDDAYTRGKQGAKGVRKRDEDGRTVYEVPFTKPIGYIGGRDGKRDNNPDAKRLRLVVEGDQVITAFPF